MPPVPDLSRLIPLSAQVVLDVGCGNGDLAAAYRRLNPGARLLGLDRDPGRIATARAHYDECVLADAEAPLPVFETHNGGTFDCIVYSAILEHLNDPIAMLRRHAAHLSDDGTMVICVSNIEHWSFADRLLRGAFRYEDQGLLDRGHRHWFSRETMANGLIAAGLVPVDAQARVFDEEKGRAFIASIAPGLRNLGVDPEVYAQTALPLQYVWRARKTAAPGMIVDGDMLRPVGGVSQLRVIHPLTALASEPGVATHLSGAANPPSPAPNDPPWDDDTPRIFIFHRPALFGAEGQRAVDSLIDKGWLVVTEFDDHPDFMRGLNNPGLISFRGVHAVQTTTPALAGVLRQRNPEMGLFPNGIASLPPIRNFTDPKTLRVFFGALNREADWRPLMGAINAVIALSGDRLRFQVVHDEGFFQALDTRHKSFMPLCDYDTYLDLLGASEISLMPLDDTPFNRAKSDLKFIEAGACRVAALASGVVYRDSIADGETGLIFDDPDSFHTQFLRLTAVPNLALDLGDNARRMVIQNRMLAGQVKPRIDWYRDLWSRREALTKALRARVAARPVVAN